jgi:hypothetical protein
MVREVMGEADGDGLTTMPFIYLFSFYLFFSMAQL